MTDKIGLTIEEAADYTGIGRNTMRKLVEWEKIPVLRIGRRYIIRIDVIEHTSFGKVKRKQQKSSIHAGLRRDGSRSDSSLSDGQGAEITIA